MDLLPVIEQSFTQYSGAVLQSRALVDVRDCLKPSARQVFYSMYLNKLTADKPFKKTNNAVGLAMVDFYIHGDASCEGIIYRAGQNFAMRYPLTEIHGNGGTIQKSGNWAAPRYTSARLGRPCEALFADIKKDTIEEWRDNYEDTKQYPAVLPTKGFYNIVNGTMGIGIGAASSIPQFNLNDVNKALEILLLNPDCSFDEIYCAPDFATGAILLNESEVKESLKKGEGFACKLRSVVEYDTGERCFTVKEIPFSVYTETICGELDEVLVSEENPGIDRYNDLSGAKPNIKIYLTKKANPDKVLRYLYKNTSLQYFYGINMTMLDNGRFPKVFTWKQALQAHIDHEKVVYRRGFEFDLVKIMDRIHIIDGLLIALASIDEVVHTIKNSASSAAAKDALMSKFLLDEPQAKAILDMKLSRLAHLEVQKLEDEKASLVKEQERINAILNDVNLFNQELVKGWRDVAKRFGDERRTKVLNIEKEDDEPTEIRSLQLSLTNKNAIFMSETSSLYTQRRNGVGTKLKLDAGEYVVATRAVQSNEEILFFSKSGIFYHCAASAIATGEKVSLYTLITLPDTEQICAATSINKKAEVPYILFFTKNGLCKKSEMTEYNIRRNGGVRAITLDENDEIVNVIFTDKARVGILTHEGNFLLIETDDIRPLSRIAKGIRAIKLNDEDYVVSAKVVPVQTLNIVSVTKQGLIKMTAGAEFFPQSKNTKGGKIQKTADSDWMADFLPITEEKQVLISATASSLKISVTDIPSLSKTAQGNKSIKLGGSDNVVSLTAG